jgi:hypothetical protein
MSERVAHASHRVPARRDLTAFLFQHVGERKIARSYDGQHSEIRSDEVASGVRSDCHTVIEWMKQFATAESSACTCGK